MKKMKTIPTKGKNKKPEDPNAPKRPVTKFVLFLKDKIQLVKQTNPELTSKEVYKEVLRLWADTKSKSTANISQEIVESAKAVVVKTEFPEFSGNEGAKCICQSRNTNINKVPNAKRPSSAFFLFCKDLRSQTRITNPGLPFLEVSKMLKDRWAVESLDTKAFYKSLADQQKIKYYKSLVVYYRTGRFPGTQKKTLLKIKKEKIESDEHVARPISAFANFCSYHRPMVKLFYPEFQSGDIAKELRNRWASTHPKIKSSYEKATSRKIQSSDMALAIPKREPIEVAEPEPGPSSFIPNMTVPTKLPKMRTNATKTGRIPQVLPNPVMGSKDSREIQPKQPLAKQVYQPKPRVLQTPLPLLIKPEPPVMPVISKSAYELFLDEEIIIDSD